MPLSRRTTLLLPLVALAALACSDNLAPVAPPAGTDPVATTITVTIDTIEYGGSVTPTIVVKDQNGTPMTGPLTGLVMESSDTTIATIDSDTKTIAGTGIGDGTITVHYGDLEAEAVVAVRLGHAPARKLAIGQAISCALDDTGTARCWGYGENGALGNGGNASSGTPVFVRGGHVFSSIHAGADRICGLEDGAVWCWGYDDPMGPVSKADGLRFVQLSAGDNHTCGLKADGTTHCWGSNSAGELGIGSSDYSWHTAEQVVGGVKFVQVEVSGRHTCALTRLGKAYCWGMNATGELGTGDKITQPSPVAVLDSITFVSIAGGNKHSCGMDRTGKVFCWGANGNGQLGIGTSGAPQLSPVQTQPAVRFAAIYSGQYDHLCGIASADRSIYCWGWNSNGQAGTGTSGPDQHSPFQVPSLQGQEVGAGLFHTCAINLNDEVYCWGYNNFGQVGNGSVAEVDVLTPTRVVEPDYIPPGCMTAPNASPGCMIRGMGGRK